MASAATQATRQIAELQRHLLSSAPMATIHVDSRQQVEDQLCEVSLQAQLAAAAESGATADRSQQSQQPQQRQQGNQLRPQHARCQRLRFYRLQEDRSRRPVVLRYNIPRSGATQRELAMKFEANRLRSFRPILEAAGSSTRKMMIMLCLNLAQAGFYHAPDGTSMEDALRVLCAFCGGCVSDWKAEESPDQVHRLLFSTCPFVLGMDVANVPMPNSEKLKLLVSCTESSTEYTWTADRAPATAEQEDLECNILQSSESHRFTQSLEIASCKAVIYRMDERHFELRYDLPQLQAITRLIGLDVKDVQEAVKERLRSTGDDFESLTDLTKAAWLLAAERLSRGPVDEAGGAAAAGPEAAFETDVLLSETDTSEVTSTLKGEKLKHEYEETDNEDSSSLPWNQCRVCMTKTIDVVLLGCGHHCCCSGCANSLDTCPICRAEIVATVTINSD